MDSPAEPAESSPTLTTASMFLFWEPWTTILKGGKTTFYLLLTPKELHASQEEREESLAAGHHQCDAQDGQRSHPKVGTKRDTIRWGQRMAFWPLVVRILPAAHCSSLPPRPRIRSLCFGLWKILSCFPTKEMVHSVCSAGHLPRPSYSKTNLTSVAATVTRMAQSRPVLFHSDIQSCKIMGYKYWE